MSDDNKPAEEPQPPAAHDPAIAPVNPAPALPVQPPTVPIDYAMRAPSKPFTVPKYAGCLAKMIFGFAVMILMGYFALMALSPKARSWATDKKHAPTPFALLNQILAIPAQAIGKTKDVVAASDARVGVLNNVIIESEGKNLKSARSVVTDPFATTPTAPGPGNSVKATDSTAAESQAISKAALIAMNENVSEAPGSQAEGTEGKEPKPGPSSREAAPTKPLAPVKLAGGIVIASASPAGSPPATPAFMYWVVNLSISGIHQGSPSRFLMNNRLVSEGQELNAALGITFDHLEFEKKLIVFRDKSGAIVTRSY